MRTVGDDKVVRIAFEHNGCCYSAKWYYNLSVRESIKRAKKVYGLTGKHNVKVIIKS